MYHVDLNCDLGESFGAFKMGMDDQVIPFISSANIACGYHAGDPVVMDQTVKMAETYGVAAGAHPGYPDLMGFGRRNIIITPKEAACYVQYQVSALMGICRANGATLRHVKPHGALYNMAGKDYRLAKAICEAVCAIDPNLILLALSGSEMVHAANSVGLRVAREVFADRAYEADGSLVARGTPGAIITDETLAIHRVIRMIKEKKVETHSGTDITIEADSICVHGDGEKALAFVQKIRTALEEEGILVQALHTFI